MSQEALEVRKENPRTAARIEQGTAYHEPVEVYFTDRTKHTVQVYALSERQFAEACKKVGATPDDFKKSEKVLDSQQLILAIAEAATGDPEICGKLLGRSGASKIALKAFELMNPPKD